MHHFRAGWSVDQRFFQLGGKDVAEPLDLSSDGAQFLFNALVATVHVIAVSYTHLTLPTICSV